MARDKGEIRRMIAELKGLNTSNMYLNDFFHTWKESDDEIAAVFKVAEILRGLRENNISSKVFDSGLGISIFRDNSTRTRFSFASACNLLGLEVQDLDEKVSQIAHGETVRETANMISFMADVIGIRDDMYRKDTGMVFSSRDLRLSIFSVISITQHSAWQICFM